MREGAGQVAGVTGVKAPNTGA